MLKIIDAGVLTTVQDTGRFGYQAYGIPVSGAMDSFALCSANALVQNGWSDAALEIHSPVLFETDAPALIAVTGAEAILKIDGRSMPLWTANFVRPGYSVEITPKRAGGWHYLAIHGGIDVARVLGSRSTFLRGRFGGFNGRALELGDEIPVGPPHATDWGTIAGKTVSDRAQAFASRERVVRVVLGPYADRFKEQATEALQHQGYILTASADRMGYRLRGAALEWNRQEELISYGVPLGALQVPADAQPIALMADHQTTGGYPTLATVISADIPIIAQCAPGDAVRFQIVSMDDAHSAWKAMWEILEDF